MTIPELAMALRSGILAYPPRIYADGVAIDILMTNDDGMPMRQTGYAVLVANSPAAMLAADGEGEILADRIEEFPNEVEFVMGFSG